MTNQEIGYYINKKRKIFDYWIGIFGVLSILFCLTYIPASLGLVGFVAVAAIVGPIAIAVGVAIWLCFKPKRKFILVGAILAVIIILIIYGSYALIIARYKY